MDSRQLHYFRTIVDSGSFTAAADKLLMAQPSLSTAVRNLEKELGAQLLIRSRSGVILTEAGREIHRLAEQVLSQMDNAAAQVRGLAAGEVGRVVLNVAPTFNWGFLPSVIRHLRREAPGISFVLEDPDPATTLAHIRAGQADIGIMPSSDVESLRTTNPDIHFEEVSSVDLVLAIPPDSVDSITPQEVSLRDFTMMDWFVPSVRSEHPGLPEALEVFWHHNPGTRPRKIHYVATILTALPMVSGGAGVTLVPRSIASLMSGAVASREVLDDIPALTLVMLWRPDRYQPPVVQRVLTTIRHYADRT